MKTSHYRPPRLAAWLLKHVLPDGGWQTPLGDFEEYFNAVAAHRGRGAARRWYWGQVLNVVPRKLCHSAYWGTIMVANYLKVAFRTLTKRKGFAFINIAGLAVGMACCMLLLLYIQDELSYDRHHERAERIYRFIDDESDWAAVGPPYGPSLADEFPDLLEETVRFLPLPSAVSVRYEDQAYLEAGISFVDSTVFRVFTYPMIGGHPETALDRPNTVVVTESIAQKYFGAENPLGQTLEFRNAQYEVTGVIEDLPPNTHYHFDILASFSSIRERVGSDMNNWDWAITYTYVLVEEGVSVDQVQALMPHFGEKYRGEASTATNNFQPITRIHLYSQLEKEVEPGGNIRYIYLLSIIAAFVLVVACINFINLTTARATDRAKEVGMRKTLGAQRAQLVRQLLGESLLLSLVALVVAVLLVEAALPLFNSVAGKSLSVRYAENLLVLGGFLGLALFVGLVAGSYPAFVLSRFRPIYVLKSNAASGSAGARLRKALVVFQFAISTFLFIGATIVYQQLEYMQNTDLGFSKEQVVVAQTDNYPVLKEALLELSDVSSVTAAWHAPGERIGFYAVHAEGMPADSLISMRSLPVSFDYLETMQIDVVAGRGFSEAMTTDADHAFVLNQAAADFFAETYGWTDPLGKKLSWTVPGAQRQGEVIGVVQDFNFASLHTEVEPLILLIWPTHSRVFVRVNTDEWAVSLAAIRAVWQDVSPTLPFDFFFVDDHLDQLYRAEQRLSRVFGAFTSIALFIACLGLFGLAAFMAAKRKKEIGIRKTFGASAGNIVVLFSKDFAALVLIAIGVAVPLAYLAVDTWLAEFAYHVAISWWVFLLAALAALAIALLTISYQSVKAALTNPVEALKYE